MFIEIKTDNDIQYFLEKTNYLHDGYIIDVKYAYHGISKIENGHYFEPDKTKLTVQILVTSIWDAVVEIEFEGLFDWQFKDKQSDIFHTFVTFEKPNRIVWSNDNWNNLSEINGTYAIASSMKWRILE